ncbi:hypothetical protein EV196_101542 [Mariniflexile fucanivorans]|uniref:Uncharacterized protein n=1 Tax=Mariniflexile fucanivorans TaxID=264023 RepID=A0A4R1RSV3_9FLAO|nr:hypothetical protein [Mariniflexile fucanivorans]TCL69110.1 hypothetical protein EV196_101542 [Mariniflexile fucanivorans]
MNVKHVSIFNLIEIFRGSRKVALKTITEKTHCEQNHLTDFYCDAETPYVSLKI